MGEKILGCVPFGVTGYVPGKDYTLSKCSLCSHSVWMGPKQRAKFAEGGWTVICPYCAGDKYGGDNIKYNKLC